MKSEEEAHKAHKVFRLKENPTEEEEKQWVADVVKAFERTFQRVRARNVAERLREE